LRIGSVKAKLSDYLGEVTVSYQVLPLLDEKNYQVYLGDVVIGSPNNPEIPNKLTD